MVEALKNYISIVLDKSSSMGPLREVTVTGFNEQIDAIHAAAADAGQTKVSLVTFASDVKVEQWNQPTEAIRKLTPQTYQPDGWTAFYDALGTVIERYLQQPDAQDPTTSFLVIVITDGEENMSKRFSGTVLGALISSLQATGRWTFTVAGANIDLTKLSKTLNVYQGNTVTWEPTTGGASVMYTTNSVGTSNYLRGRSLHGTAFSATASFYDPDQSPPVDPTFSTAGPASPPSGTGFYDGGSAYTGDEDTPQDAPPTT